VAGARTGQHLPLQLHFFIVQFAELTLSLTLLNGSANATTQIVNAALQIIEVELIGFDRRRLPFFQSLGNHLKICATKLAELLLRLCRFGAAIRTKHGCFSNKKLITLITNLADYLFLKPSRVNIYLKG